MNFSLCSEQEHFVLLCLRLLSTHLSLALAGGVAGSVIGSQARPLRNLLFRLMDMNTPQGVQVNLFGFCIGKVIMAVSCLFLDWH